MKKLLSFVLVIAILICSLPIISLTASALTYGNFTYTVLDGEATITDCSESVSGNIAIPEQINGYTVVAIADNAFENCDGIESVKIPYKVRSIGENIFAGCDGVVARVYEESFAQKYMIMKSIDFEILTVAAPAAPTAAYVTENSITLTYHSGYEYRVSGGDWQSSPVFECVFPDSGYVFYQRVAQTFDHPASESSEGTMIETPTWENADYYIWQINRYEFSGYRRESSDLPYLSKVIVPSSHKGYPVTAIGNYVLDDEPNLREVIIPEGVETIMVGAFKNSPSLETVKIPDSMKKIDTEAFMDCTGLKNVILGSNVNYIGQNAFKNCTSLINIVLPDSLTTIRNGIFYGCTALKTVIIPKNLALLENSTFSNCENIEIVEVPNTVTEVGLYAFDGCKNLTVMTTLNSATDKYIAKSTYNEDVGYYSSVKSKAPEIFYRNDTTAILVPFEGYEYRVDSGAWQDSNVFEGLQPGTTHLFYQRVKSSSAYNRQSAPLWVKMKTVPTNAYAPNAIAVTDTSIALEKHYGYEYKMGNGEWQTSNVFENLTLGTEYTFYQRVAETGISVASRETKSYITTQRPTANTPDTPIVTAVTDKTVQLQETDGYEYKVNNGAWQSSGLFTNLNPGTAYTFYQRVAESDRAYASEASDGTKITTNKAVASKPSAPTVKSKTEKSVTLTAISGYEYKMNNGAWQKSNVFTNLAPDTAYTFYQRKAETTTTYASAASNGLVVTTSKFIKLWKSSNGKWWYDHGDGTYAKGWEEIDGVWYYFDANGWMQTGWEKIGSKWYYLNSSGAMQTGWLKLSGLWYYLDDNGVMQTGLKEISGVWYFFNSSGAMLTGWQRIGDWYFSSQWYYFNASGAMQTGWLKLSGVWYYLDDNGAMQTGFKEINGAWYFFNSSGAMQTGWHRIGESYYNSDWYYFNKSGAMHFGWLKLGGKWYFLNSDGKMLTGNWYIDGVPYYFNSSGVCLNP